MMLQVAPPLRMRLVICHTPAEERVLREAGVRSVRAIGSIDDVYKFVPSTRDYQLDADLDGYDDFIIAMPTGQEQLRDDLAVRLGDTKCRWVVWPKGIDSAADFSDCEPSDLTNLIETSRPMWTDEICTIDDIPEPGEEQSYEIGLDALDRHGFRLVRPAFMPVIGPYGSGKSVLLRQIAVNLWRKHGWRTLITSFEEKVKPRYQRDLRRHLIGHNRAPWTAVEIGQADAEIRQAFRFMRRKRNAVLDMDRFLDRVEYAVKVYGVDVVILDPVNELDHQVPKGESKTDYMGRFIMRCKQMADDYNLLFIAAAHPPKDGVEKRLSKNQLLTLNDGADTAHYGNKADIGWCVWRNLDGPTYLHIDKLKDHETMGKPTLAELILDEEMNCFRVSRTGYEIFGEGI